MENMGETTIEKRYNLAQSKNANLMGFSKNAVSKNYVDGQYNSAGSDCGNPPNFNLPYYSKYQYNNECDVMDGEFKVNGINVGEDW